MIKKPTVFILGAGAHCSYGFPSGKELKPEVAQIVGQTYGGPHEYCLNALADGHTVKIEDVSSDRCEVFAQALSRSGQASIDAFLNANRNVPGFPEIGKAGIAQILLKMEGEKTLDLKEQGHTALSPNDDWLSHIFERMSDGASTPDEFVNGNRVAFITFNYDRFLEWWLHDRIFNSYFHLSEQEAYSYMQKIPIVHVYGQLGKFNPRSFGKDRTWLLASKGIKTIYEIEHDAETLREAHSILDGAMAICLLGFGFHQENIDILELDKHTKRCNNMLAASRFGMTDAEFQTGLKRLGGVQIDNRGQRWGCLQTLRNSTIF